MKDLNKTMDDNSIRSASAAASAPGSARTGSIKIRLPLTLLALFVGVALLALVTRAGMNKLLEDKKPTAVGEMTSAVCVAQNGDDGARPTGGAAGTTLCFNE